MIVDNVNKFGNDIFKIIFNTLPLPIFIVDDDVVILDLNDAAQKMLKARLSKAIHKRCGEVFHCIHSTETAKGCGRAPACSNCVIRNSVKGAFKGGKTYRRRTKAELKSGNKVEEIELLITSTPFNVEDQIYVLLILEDISEITALRSIIPICANCKKIRNDQFLWDKVEVYFTKFLGVDFSHSICPECSKKLYPEFLEETP
jgi:PAS domain-containing protein